MRFFRTPRLNFRIAKRLVGLAPEFEISSEEEHEFAQRVVREKIVEARRDGLDAVAAKYSEVKALFKKRWITHHQRRCPTCGGCKSLHANECQMCSVIRRNYHHTLTMQTEEQQQEKEFVIESTYLVTPRQLPRAPLTAALTKLANEGQVGDSFIVKGKPATTIKTVARLLGLEVICRKLNTPGEKDQKKLRLRVWRSDGLDEEGVNEILRKRMAGQTVPPPKKCVPLTAAEAAKVRAKRSGRPPGRPPTNE